MLEAMKALNTKNTLDTRVSISSVGSTLAAEVVEDLGLSLVDGNSVHPIRPPDDGFPSVPAFDMHSYKDENTACFPYLKYLEVTHLLPTLLLLKFALITD